MERCVASKRRGKRYRLGGVNIFPIPQEKFASIKLTIPVTLSRKYYLSTYSFKTQYNLFPSLMTWFIRCLIQN